MQESENITRLRAGFENYYRNILQPKFADMEAVRKKYLRYFVLGILIVFVILPLICLGLLSLYLIDGGSVEYNGESMEWILLGILLLITAASTPLMIFKRQAKSRVMPEFIKYFGDFQYQYQTCIDESIIDKSKLFGDYNRHEGDDFFSGYYKNVQMTISEEKLRFYRCSDGGKRVSYAKIFQGIMILLSMNKSFSGQTVVLKDWGIFNSLHRLGKSGGLQKISLEDSVFEKEFEVFGSDQLEARYLLTTAFMERMLRVRDAFKGKKIQFSFFENKLLIAIDSKKDMFESTSLFRSTTDRKLINETFEQVVSIMAVIDILKLDRRIGM